jgi:2-polyprenyl-6-methoxyphenol hydroxylase-like FAD-dependent oxidoreductase
LENPGNFHMAWCAARDSVAHLKRKITIAGGGLAGLSLGIALRGRGVPVTILEAGNYPRHRVCGEFISGVSQETLCALGIADALDDARRHETLTWHDCGHCFLTNKLPVPALGISRYALDERLRLRFRAIGGELRTATRARPQATDGLVWAAGRRPRPGRWIGLKAHVRLATSTDLEMHSGSNGYAGLAGVEDGWTNVCGLFLLDRELAPRGSDLLAAYIEAGGNMRLATALRAAEWRDDSFSSVAGFELGYQPAVPGLLCLGDAESMIPPFTGNGMSMAFQAAECALEPLHSWSEGRATWAGVRTIIRSRLHKGFRRRLIAAALLHRALLHSGMRRALGSLARTGVLPFRPLLPLVR